MQMLLQGSSARPASLRKQPFHVTRSFHSSAEVNALITLHLISGLDISQHVLQHTVSQTTPGTVQSETQTYHFKTQEQQYGLEPPTNSSLPMQASQTASVAEPRGGICVPLAEEPACKRSQIH